MSLPDNTPSESFNLRIYAISAGDIVFVYNETARGLGKVKEFINVSGQRVLASMRKGDNLSLKQEIRKHSHVMLGMDGGLIIHADGKTVAIEVISDALRFQTNEALRFQVYRHKSISKDTTDKIVKSAMRYYNQHYRFLSYFAKMKEGDTTQFCSKLIAQAYRSAGVPLTLRPDNKVLPVHLYQIVCQSDEWKDITAEFIEEPLSPVIDEMFSPIEVPGEGEMSLTDFLAGADALLLTQARRDKQLKELQYKHLWDMLHAEALLGKYCALQFKLAQKNRLKPFTLSDTPAVRIVRVLEQLQALLDLSQLPSIELLIDNSFLNTVEEGQTNIGLYVRQPSPLAIREMQMKREAIAIYSYLLFAEIGLCTILAHLDIPFEESKLFRAVKSEYADRFLTALPQINDLSPYENEKELFKWVEGESDRATSQRIFHNIVIALKVIKTLSDASSKSD